MRIRFIAFQLLLGVAVAILSMPLEARAQLTRGAISGTVRDQAGASIPDALVRVINPQTKLNRETTTNNEGFYRMGALEPGIYTVTVEKAGFDKIENRAVSVLQTNETTFDVELKPGAITSTVDGRKSCSSCVSRGQPSDENGTSAEEYQVSSTSGSRVSGPV